jgi:hypothetical protein
MANDEHLKILKQGVEVWNHWRSENPTIRPDLHRAKLIRADLRNANFSGAYFIKADLCGTRLQGADLHGANLIRADLRGAQLSGANLTDANLSGANLYKVNFSGADLSRADLLSADLVEANLKNAILTGCRVYGISAWNLDLEGAEQSDVIITLINEPTITVDNLEVAQFIYLLLNNKKIRDVIDTITSKVVLILGRFTPERKAVLDGIRDGLRQRGYLPVLFDFDKPTQRDITETVSTLAHMARFIIADITDAKSIAQELMLIVPNLPSVPVQPLLLASQHEYSMFEHFQRYPWVLEPFLYHNLKEIMSSLESRIIAPAEGKAIAQVTN